MTNTAQSFRQNLNADARTRAQVYAALQDDPKYNRLFARKDAKLHAWVQLDARRSASDTPWQVQELKKAHQASTRALRALRAYEDAALAKAGLRW